MLDYFLKYFSKRSRVLPLSHVIENNESYLHLTGLAGPSGCVCEPQDEMGAFLGILKQSSYTLAWHVRCRYKRDDFL